MSKTKNHKTKKVTITMTEAQQAKGKANSIKRIGQENLSGYIVYLLEKDDKKK